jgi:hypothetical protein
MTLEKNVLTVHAERRRSRADASEARSDELISAS